MYRILRLKAHPGAMSSLLVAIACSVTTWIVPAAAGEIDPLFETHLATLPADEEVSVIIMLAEQAPIARLDEELRTSRASLATRHERVIVALREVAARTQPALLADLESRKAVGEVKGYTPYWIANLVVAQVKVESVTLIAARPEVGTVYQNFTTLLIESPLPKAPDGPSGAMVNSATPGLRAINAHRVWYELGITGAGRLVCGLDTGVMGTHAALGSRWRGTHVPSQHAWLDRLGNTTLPYDNDGHGTGTMAIMTGLGAATGDTVGVAFGAEWIACNAIGQQGGTPEFDNDVLAAFQWIADPDGNAQTVSDVPDVVQNSWGVGSSPYPPCDARWWLVIDACEAAGCAVVFSAGNEGPSAQTIRSPADRITSPTNALSVGSVDGRGDPTLLWFNSSQGPSECPGTPAARIKPETVAPGVDIYTAFNDGGYTLFGGTSSAGPHVAGIFALMRQANPNLDVTTMKQIIMATARDLGVAGEDNTSGWGLPDAYTAVVAATTGVGEITGIVTSEVGGTPIAGAKVTVAGEGRVFITDAQGAYHGHVVPGMYSVTASHRSYASETQAGVVVAVGSPVTVDFSLVALPGNPDCEVGNLHAPTILTGSTHIPVAALELFTPLAGCPECAFVRIDTVRALQRTLGVCAQRGRALLWSADLSNPQCPVPGVPLCFGDFVTLTPPTGDHELALPLGCTIRSDRTYFLGLEVPELINCPLGTQGILSEAATCTGYVTFPPVFDWFDAGVAVNVFADATCLSAEAIAEPAQAPVPAFRLYANQPNPFNPNTTIQYELPARSAVRLTIYDVSGRLVRVLVDGTMQDPGLHRAQWNAHDESESAVASGVYFFRLEANGQVETRIGTLIR